jgi:hypothetical protein
MTLDEIKTVLNEVIDSFLEKKIDKDEVVRQLNIRLNPEEIYNLDNEFMVTDCYFAIKHLTEDGYETTLKELQYFRECFLGRRLYDLNEKNEYILGK